MSADFVPTFPELEPEPDAWVTELAEYTVSMVDADADVAELATELAQLAMEGDLVDSAPEGARRFTVTDDGSAEWAMAHVVAATTELEQLQRQRDEWHAAADERKARIDQWFAHRAKPLQATVGFMSAHLERYALRVREETKGKRKSVMLPSGVVPTTSSAPKVVVSNAQRAYAWACQHAQAALKPREPELQVSLLRQVVKPVQLTTVADLTLSCGCQPQVSSPDGLTLPDVGTEMECEGHGAVLLGRVDVVASRWVPVCTTDGQLAEGVDVDPGGVTAKVVPAP